MAIDFATLKQILERSRNDLRAVLPDLDPSIVQSFVRAIIDSNAGRAYDLTTLQKQVLAEAFPQTSTGTFAEQWAGYNNLERQAAQPSIGSIIMQGTSGTAIPSLTTLTSKAGDEYETQANVTISTLSQALASANASASLVVTCVTTGPHSLATGALADFTNLLSGANTTAAEVTIIDDNTFSYIAPLVTVTGDVLDTGAQYSFDGVVAEVQSVETGLSKNLGSGSVLSLVTPITGVNDDGFVTFGGLKGGTDQESSESLIDRTISRRANPVANFNSAAIRLKAREIASVTRVFIQEITPYAGAVTVYFFVSDSVSGVPNASQVTTVRDKILEIKPVTTDSVDVIIEAPNVVSVAHIIDGLTPNTQTLKDAIEANLRAWYEDLPEETAVGMDVATDQIKGVIQNSQDPTNGDFPTSFILALPTTTTAVADDEIAIFGSLVYT